MVVNGIVKFIKVWILASITALIAVVYLPPDVERKSFDEQNLTAYQQKYSQLEDAINEQHEIQLVFSESDLNAGMAQVLKAPTNTASTAPSAAPGASQQPAKEPSRVDRPESVYIHLEKDLLIVTAQWRWKWFRLSVQTQFKMSKEDGKWGFQPVSARIGRLRVPPQFNQKIGGALKIVWKENEKERQWIEQLNSVEIKPGLLTLTTKKPS